MIARTSTLAAGVLALGTIGAIGCGGPPPLADPDLPVDMPNAWSAPRPAGVDAPSDSDPAVVSWWDSFEDEDLRGLVAEALAHNLDLAAARERLRAAAAAATIAGADVFPQVSANGTGSRAKQVFVGLPIPSSGGGPVTSTSESFGVSLDVSWELDLWGRTRSGRSAAAADLQAAEADWEGGRLSLAAQTLKAAFACREGERQLALATETVDSWRRTEERVRARYRAGVAPAIDLRLTISDRAQAEAALADRRAALEAARRQLELLLGRVPAARFVTEDALGPVPAPVPAGLPADLLRRRPDLVAAERRLAAAGRRTWAAKAGLLPRITLTGSGGRTGAEIGDLLDGDFSVWRLAASVLQPIFQGGKLRAGVTQAASLERAAEAEWAGLVLRALGEVEGALASERHLAAREDALTVASEQALAAFDLATSRYESGLDDVITLLSAQRAARAIEGQRLTARRLRLEARVDLHLALGGGFRLPDVETAAATPRS